MSTSQALSTGVLLRLPLRALAALCARSLRRALPLYNVTLGTREEEASFLDTLGVLGKVEWCARGAAWSAPHHHSKKFAERVDAAGCLASAARSLAEFIEAGSRLAVVPGEGHAPRQPLRTVAAVFDHAATVWTAVREVFRALGDLYSRHQALTGNSAGALDEALWHDVERLDALSEERFPGEGPAVEPSEMGPLGPLWPGGEPAWFADLRGRQGVVREKVVANLLRSPPLPAETAKLERFPELAVTWKAERGPTSSARRMATHPAYQEIIDLGPRAIPLLLREAEQRPDHWFWALHTLTDAEPVPESGRGKLAEMARAWAQWGRERGYID
jgi:hypothetical protein